MKNLINLGCVLYKKFKFVLYNFKVIKIQFSFEEDCILVRQENSKKSKKSVEKEMGWRVAMSGGSLCRYVNIYIVEY